MERVKGSRRAKRMGADETVSYNQHSATCEAEDETDNATTVTVTPEQKKERFLILIHNRISR